MHLLDYLYGLSIRHPTFFADGWGDEASLADSGPAELLAPPSPVEIHWDPARREAGMALREGTFESPERRLPHASRVARVRALSPAAGPSRGGLVLLASSGDQGFVLRTAFARPLAQAGLEVLLLENPYYGRRRPPEQRGVAVRSVWDLVVMASATVAEARALLAWARAQGHARVGVAGYSMGGQMAAVAAACEEGPLAAVPMAPSCSPASVFTEGVLRTYPVLAALARPGQGAEATRAALRAFLLRFSVTSLPPPRAPGAAIVVATRRDGVVPPADQEAVARHWGCELRWLDAGHLSAVLQHREAMRRAVLDAFARL